MVAVHFKNRKLLFNLVAVEEGISLSDESVESTLTVDSLVRGALESSFWAMDRLVLRDSAAHRIDGGCAAIVALFVLGR